MFFRICVVIVAIVDVVIGVVVAVVGGDIN